jgi:3-oxoacyl-[acyl-carrier protein] reductase
LTASATIVGGDPNLARALAGLLDERGTKVVTVTDDEASGSATVRNLQCDTSVADQVRSCLDEAESMLGEPPALLRLGIRSAQAAAADVATLSLDEWIGRAESPLRETLAFHQAAQRFLADRGGRILVVIPTVGLSGGPGFVPLATTAEADRSLVKAQARVSGVRGITLNCVAVATSILAGALLATASSDPDRTGLPKHALPMADLGQVADVIVGLLGAAFDGVTGQTIAVDGGRWMAP